MHDGLKGLYHISSLLWNFGMTQFLGNFWIFVSDWGNHAASVGSIQFFIYIFLDRVPGKRNKFT